jgi:hypothetical protein
MQNRVIKEIIALIVLFCVISVAEQNPEVAVTATPDVQNAVLRSVVDQNGKPAFGIGDRVVVTVDNISAFFAQRPHDGDQPLLFIDHLPMRGAELLSIDSSCGKLLYELGYDSLFACSWKKLYRLGHAEVKAMVTVGYEGAGSCILMSEKPVTLIMYHRTTAIFAFIALLAAIIAFMYMARKTAIIRDGDARSSYSLGKTQLAWWSFIIIGSYVFIGIATGVLPKLTTDIITLLGISMGTTAGAKALDRVGSKKGSVNAPSTRFLDDLLSDDSGVNIHRFQMFLWTLVFGAFFIGRSLSKLELPTIDNGQLLLMGISSATYLGLRTAEKNGVSGDGGPDAGKIPDADNPSTDGSVGGTTRDSGGNG